MRSVFPFESRQHVLNKEVLVAVPSPTEPVSRRSRRPTLTSAFERPNPGAADRITMPGPEFVHIGRGI